MSKRFMDDHKVDMWADPIMTNTAVRYTQWYDMYGHNEINFFVSGAFEGSSHGTTAVQFINFQIYKATNSTGGGATAVSSATGRFSKVGTAITTAAKAKSLFIGFTTAHLTNASLGATLSILGKDFLSATANSAAGAFCGLSSVAATVGAESFKTAFNTHASLSSWVAEVGPANTAAAYVTIRPKSETAVGATVYVKAGGSTIIPVGVPGMGGHLSIKTELLGEGYRYVALGIKCGSSGMTTGANYVRQPVSVFAIRTAANDSPTISTKADVQFNKNVEATML